MSLINSSFSAQAVAPSGKIDRTKFNSGITFLKNYFPNFNFNDSIYSIHRNMAGKDYLRSSELIESLNNDDIDLVWSIRGGFGASRVLPYLKHNIKIKNPKKRLIGYSDITAYQLFLYENYGLKGISGGMIQVDFPIDENSTSIQWLLSLIKNNTSEFNMPPEVQYNSKVEFDGVIIGGCLSVITKLFGTPYVPSFKDKILFLEDVNEPIYKLDGYFSHLKNAGVFDEIQGVVLGQFTNSNDEVESNYLDKLYELYDEYFFTNKIKTLYNFPIGHFKGTYPLPIGYKSKITQSKLVFVNDNL